MLDQTRKIAHKSSQMPPTPSSSSDLAPINYKQSYISYELIDLITFTITNHSDHIQRQLCLAQSRALIEEVIKSNHKTMGYLKCLGHPHHKRMMSNQIG